MFDPCEGAEKSNSHVFPIIQKFLMRFTHTSASSVETQRHHTTAIVYECSAIVQQKLRLNKHFERVYSSLQISLEKTYTNLFIERK